jgi:hypothetical protein
MEDLIKETIEEVAYLDFEKDFNEVMMNTPRDSFGKFIQSSVIVEGVHVGWYQDTRGSLYHYDGVVWDIVPDGSISRLEYLG